jgi:DHA3 family macrolide efflux protein-like MFS transporter
LISQSGDYIFDVVALWLVLQLPDPIFKVGLTTAVILVPGVLIGPAAGVYVDKLNRRDVIVAANIFQAVIVSVIALLYSLGQLQFILLLLFLFLLNSGAQFVRPAVSAVIPRITRKEDLAAANGLFSISSSVNQIAGYGIGGILVLLLGVVVPIYYDSLTFIIATFTATLISRPILAVPPATGEVQTMVDSVSFWQKFMEGLLFIRKSRVLLELIVLATILNFFGGGIQTLVAPYSKLTLNGNAGTYGALLVGLSIGTVLGSILVGKVNARKYVGKLLFLGVVVTGAAVVLIGLTSDTVLAVTLMLIIGVALALANLPIQVLVQIKVPGELLGRVTTSLVAIVTVAQPIAAITTGTIAGTFSIGWTLIFYGLAMMIVTGGGYVVFREVREAKY